MLRSFSSDEVLAPPCLALCGVMCRPSRPKAVAAFFISYPLGWSVSATIILVLGGLFLLAYIFSPRYGLFSKRRHS